VIIFKKVLKWGAIIVLGLYVVLVIVRMFHFQNVEDTKKEVDRIHNTKLTLDDVMGKNLPPDPGSEADKTVEGIDANNNNIRDDVELAIFKEYPKSAKTRAVLLQYALALQMEVTSPIVNMEVVIAAVQEEDRAHLCVGEILTRSNMEKFISDSEKLRMFVKNKQLNIEERRISRTEFYNNIGSYSSLDRVCDIDYSKLSN
jgi:hypothetical protein